MCREWDETNVPSDISAVFEVGHDGAKAGVFTLGATGKMGRPFLAGNIEIAVCCELCGENFESKIGV